MRDWLKEKRTEKGMTMAEMAKRLDLSESYYSKIESGDRQKKMDVSLAIKIGNTLGISIEEIIAKEGT